MRRTLVMGVLAGFIAFHSPPANNLKENSVTMITVANVMLSPDIGLNTGPAGDNIGIALTNYQNFGIDNDLGVARAPAPAASLAMYSDSASTRAPAMAASGTGPLCSYTVGTGLVKPRGVIPGSDPLRL